MRLHGCVKLITTICISALLSACGAENVEETEEVANTEVVSASQVTNIWGISDTL